jgi:hypothetical protein
MARVLAGDPVAREVFRVAIISGSEVRRSPKQFVKGDQRDLDEVVGKPRSSAPPNIEERTP